jgi:hypothetical protein
MVFENKVMGRMFGLTGFKIIGVLGKPHIEGLHNLYSTSHTNRMLKSKRMQWAWNVERM